MSTLKEEPTKLDSYSLFWWKIEHHKPKDMEIKDYVQSLFQEKRFSIYQKDYGLAMKVISMDPKSLSLFNDVGCNSQYMNNVLSNENIDVQSRLELIMKYQDKIGPDGFMIPECLTKNLEVIKVIIEKRPDLFDIFDSNDLKSLNYNFIQYKLLKTLYKQDEVKPEKQTDGFEYYFYLKEEPSNDDVFFNLLKKCGWTPYELSESKKSKKIILNIRFIKRRNRWKDYL